MHKCRNVLLGAIILGLMPAAAIAQDEERSSLEDRIALLEAAIAELKSELAKEREDIVRVEQKADEVVTAIEVVTAANTPTNNGFRVGETRLGIGGIIDLDANVTDVAEGSIASGSIARDFYIPGATPIGGAEGQNVTDITAQASRIYFTADREVGKHNVSGRIELDFLGSLQGDERVVNSFSPRIRLAYVDVDGLRFGQDWTTFQNTAAIPESASFLVLSDGMVFIRQPLIRYTWGPWQFAIENGDTTVTSLPGARVEADSQRLPDAVVRYNMKGDYGDISFSALARELRGDVAGMVDDSKFGWALSASGRINLFEQDDIRFNIVGGEGVGRYVGLNATNAAFVSPTGELEPITTVGGLVAYRHVFGNSTWRTNFGWSGLFADNPDFSAPTVTKMIQSGFASLLFDIAPRVTVGGEALYGIREQDDGQTGDLFRFTFSTKYAF
ncbi:MAG: DcaP family trimeric outer membrane transporter [Pseudomonadota bacterium]